MDADLKARADLELALRKALWLAVDKQMVWGKDDCALWCADIIRDALGYDPALKFRGTFDDRAGASLMLGKTGLLGALRTSARRHRWRQIKPDDGLVGDMGLAILNNVEGKMIQSCVICRAPKWFIARSEHGFTAIASRFVARAWAVI